MQYEKDFSYDSSNNNTYDWGVLKQNNNHYYRKHQYIFPDKQSGNEISIHMENE
jgi:hypothetical protein